VVGAAVVGAGVCVGPVVGVGARPSVVGVAVLVSHQSRGGTRRALLN